MDVHKEDPDLKSKKVDLQINRRKNITIMQKPEEPPKEKLEDVKKPELAEAKPDRKKSDQKVGESEDGDQRYTGRSVSSIFSWNFTGSKIKKIIRQNEWTSRDKRADDTDYWWNVCNIQSSWFQIAVESTECKGSVELQSIDALGNVAAVITVQNANLLFD